MFGITRRNSNALPAATGPLNLSAEDYGLLLGIYEQQLGTREDIMAISKQVQDLLDRSKQESDLIKSMATSMKALLQQSADMQAKLDMVPVAPAPAMSQEDKDALNELAGDMDTAILTAQEAIPKNTPQEKGAAQAGANQGDQQSSMGGSTGIASQAQGGSISGAGDSTQTGGSTDQGAGAKPPTEGTATDPDGKPATGDTPPGSQSTSQTQQDAAASDSQHKQDADASQQAKPLAGTGGS